MNQWLQVLAPVIQRIEKSRAGAERKRRWMSDPRNAAHARRLRRARDRAKAAATA